MTDEERDEILAAVAQQSRDTHFLLVAVIELLIERKVLNGKQEEFLALLEQRGAALAREEDVRLWAKERTRLLIEMSKNLP